MPELPYLSTVHCAQRSTPTATAVILAERSAEERVAGLLNLDRLVLSGIAAGIRRFVVLTPGPDRARGLLRPTALAEADIRFAFPGSPEAAAELAAIAQGGEGGGGARFVLLHTEITLDPRYLIRLLEAAGDDGAWVGTTEGIAPDHPLALGVATRGTTVTAMAPGSARHLIGVGLLPVALAPVLAGGVAAAATELAAAYSRAVQAGELFEFADPRELPSYAAFLPAGRRTWNRRHRLNLALVRSVSKESDGFVARHLNRRLSSAITAWLVATPITPNLLTFATLVLAVATGLALAHGSHLWFLLGTFLFHANSTLDGCDGELARVRFQTSRTGEWADNICDQVGNLVFALAIPIGLWRMHSTEPVYLVLGVLVVGSILGCMPVVYLRSRRNAARGADFADYGSSVVRSFPTGSLRARFINVLAHICRRDCYALIFFLLSLAGMDEWVLYILSLGMFFHVVSLFIPPSQPLEPVLD